MNNRKCAFHLLQKIYKNDAYVNLVLSDFLKREKLKEQDRKFITQLIYGIIRYNITLEFIISKYLTKPLKKLDADILIILKMGIFQIKYMDSVPDSAACDESVKLAKELKGKTKAGFVNALLRNFIRNPEKGELPKGNKAKDLAIRYSHPLWMVKKFIKEFGSEQATKLLEFNNEIPKLTMRINTLKTTKEEMANELQNLGIDYEFSKKIPECVMLENHPPLNKLDFLQKGKCQIQEFSSMLVSYILDPQKGDTVLDLCAAPGGKTTHLAEKMGNAGEILACDIHPHKINLIRENAHRLGIKIIKAREFNGKYIGYNFKNHFDKILVDAPCSGLGVLRKKVDSRLRKKEEDLKKLPPLQLEILNSASKSLKIGGTLVYSTCTILQEENEKIIKKFLLLNDNFVLEDAHPYLPFKLKHKQGEKMIKIIPYEKKTDGFFIARLKKIR